MPAAIYQRRAARQKSMSMKKHGETAIDPDCLTRRPEFRHGPVMWPVQPA
jgi:hypothetical protein